VVWLQAQACTGCSVSLLNSIYYLTVDTLLTTTLDVKYHPNLMAAVGSTAIGAAQAAYAKGGYILVVEGAVPMGASGKFCTVWPKMTALNAVRTYAAKASAVIAVGTCASFGGIPKGAPHPTGATSVKAVVGTKPVINIPGCPVNPDWLVGTVAYLLQYGKAPALDSYRRPTQYFSRTVHSRCPYNDDAPRRTVLGQRNGCLRALGCTGPETRADCPNRKWNSPAASTNGVNWCIGAGSPCQGCTEPNFPDGKSPFYMKRAPVDDD
jgi:hydrogenase small subunit